MSDPDDPQSWLAKARNDLQCIRNNLIAATIPWDTVAFHAQQAAEKMLKAFLVSRGQTVPRTHDLGRLLGECLVAGAPLSALSADCDLLTPYAVVMRYPGLQPDVDEHEARKAVDAANRIHTAVLALIPPPARGHRDNAGESPHHAPIQSPAAEGGRGARRGRKSVP